MTDIASITFRADATQIRAAKAELDGMSRSAKGTEKQIQRTEKETKKYAETVDKAEKETKGFTESVDRAEKEAKGFADTLSRTGRESSKASGALARTDKSTRQLSTTTATSTKAFSVQKGALQQAGFQIQDFAVQVGGGTSALVAFSQQGSQLAGIFGPGGAVLGAVIAIGATVANVLGPALATATKDFRALQNEIDSFIEKSAKAQFNEVSRLIENQQGILGDYARQIRAIRSEETGFIEGLISSEEDLAKAEQDRSLKLIKLQRLKAEGEEKLNQLVQRRNEFSAEIGQAGSVESSKQLDELVASLKEQAATLGKTNREMALYQATLMNASETEKELINSYYDEIEASEQKQEALKKAAAEERKAQQEREKATKMAEQQAQKLLKEQQAYEKSVESLVDSLDPLGKAFKDVYRSQQLLIQAEKDGLITAEERDGLIKRLVEGMANLKNESETAADDFTRAFEQASDRVASSLQDAITSGDWDGIGASIGGALAGGISGAVTNKLQNALGGGLASSIIGGIGGAVAGGLVGLAVNEVSEFFSRKAPDPTAARQASQGTGSVLGSINEKSKAIVDASEMTASATDRLVGINTAMLESLNNLQTGIMNAVGMIARESTGNIRAPLEIGNVFDNIGGIGGQVASLGSATALLGPIGALFGDALGNLLGGSSKKVDEGIELLGGQVADLMEFQVGETLALAYADFRTREGFWQSSRISPQTAALGEELNRQFSLVFSDIFNTVLSGANTLGIDAESALSGFSVEGRKISLEGLNAEEQQAELIAEFGTIFSEMAAVAAPFIMEMQQAGEELGETLIRVATNVDSAKEVISQVGGRFGVAMSELVEGASSSIIILEDTLIANQNPEIFAERMAQISTAFVEAAGGIDQLAQSMNTFKSEFLSEDEQFELLTNDVARVMERLGQAMPATRAEFTELVQSINVFDESTAQMKADLLSATPLLDEYFDTLEDRQEEATAQLRSLYDSLMADLQNEATGALRVLRESIERDKAGIQRLGSIIIDGISSQAEAEIEQVTERYNFLIDDTRTSIDSLSDSVSSLSRLSGDLANTYNSLRTGSIGESIGRRQTAQSRISSALSIARAGGSLSDIDLSDSLREVSRPSAGLFSSSTDYLRDFFTTASAVGELSDLASNQLTFEEQSLKAAKDQLEEYRKASKEQIKAIEDAADAQIAAAEADVDRLITGLDETFGTYQAAVEGVSASNLSVAAAVQNVANAIARRDAASNSSPSAALEFVRRSNIPIPGLNTIIGPFGVPIPVPGYANGGTPGGLGMVGEIGPELYDFGANRVHSASSTSGGFAELIQEIRSLRSDNLQLQRKVIQNTRDMKTNMDRWTKTGIPQGETIT